MLLVKPKIQFIYICSMEFVPRFSTEYHDGFDDGYDKGYEDGIRKRDGLEIGYQEGYYNGHREGIKKGKRVELELKSKLLYSETHCKTCKKMEYLVICIISMMGASILLTAINKV